MAQILAIEFTEQECKVAVGDLGRAKPVIRDLFKVGLPKNDDVAQRVAERAKLLKEALAARKIRIRRARIVVPKNFVMVRMVTLPSTNDDELCGMARFEAERHIPFNAERHVVSHFVLNKLGVEGSQVLIAAIDRPIAQEYIDVCRGAGLVVETLGVSSLAAFNAFAASTTASMEGRVVALLNIGQASTDLAIVNDGVLSFSRGIPVNIHKLIAEFAAQGRAIDPQNLQDIDVLDTRHLRRESDEAGMVSDEWGESTSGTIVLDAALQNAPTQQSASSRSPVSTWLLQLLKEMRRTYEFARREFNCPPITDILLCGEGALLRNLDRFFQVNFGVEAKVFSACEAYEFLPVLAKEAERLGTVYAVVLGALAPATPRSVLINLVPPEYVKEIETKRRRQSYITTGILVAVALVLAYVYVWDLFARQGELLEIYQQKNREMKTRVEDLEEKKKKLEIIRRYIQDKHGALDIIERISSFEFIPERVTLTRFEYRKDEAVKIEGHAKTIADINRFDAELKKTGIFESVVQDQGSNNPIRLPNRPDPVLQFQITCTFPKRAPEKAASKQAAAEKATKEEASADGTE
ncbi:MAG: pilus assembly protein PilM [Candidatus Sumerlaeaceae bacterium]|nr:pilus assembly protein PilM [Candidatus Sumerlaeaceae bacterium]